MRISHPHKTVEISKELRKKGDDAQNRFEIRKKNERERIVKDKR